MKGQDAKGHGVYKGKGDSDRRDLEKKNQEKEITARTETERKRVNSTCKIQEHCPRASL